MTGNSNQQIFWFYVRVLGCLIFQKFDCIYVIYIFFRWSPSLRLAGEGGQLADFIDGLGPGQLVGRQVLGAPALGDIQLSLCYQKGFLEVEVVRARGLQARPGSKVLPGK